MVVWVEKVRPGTNSEVTEALQGAHGVDGVPWCSRNTEVLGETGGLDGLKFEESRNER